MWSLLLLHMFGMNCHSTSYQRRPHQVHKVFRNVEDSSFQPLFFRLYVVPAKWLVSLSEDIRRVSVALSCEAGISVLMLMQHSLLEWWWRDVVVRCRLHMTSRSWTCCTPLPTQTQTRMTRSGVSTMTDRTARTRTPWTRMRTRWRMEARPRTTTSSGTAPPSRTERMSCRAPPWSQWQWRWVELASAKCHRGCHHFCFGSSNSKMVCGKSGKKYKSERKSGAICRVCRKIELRSSQQLLILSVTYSCIRRVVKICSTPTPFS